MHKKILVIDDHEIIYEGIVSLSKKYLPEVEVHGIDDINIVDEALKKDNYSLIILDVNIPNGNALGFVEKMKSRQADIPILVFSALEEKIMAQSFLRAGAKGYIQKSESHHEILHAIKTVLEGNKYMSAAVSELLFNTAYEIAFNKRKDIDSLTGKEAEILNLIRDGKKAKEITDLLNISISNVYLHKRNIYKKLNVKDDIELTRALEKLY